MDKKGSPLKICSLDPIIAKLIIILLVWIGFSIFILVISQTIIQQEWLKFFFYSLVVIGFFTIGLLLLKDLRLQYNKFTTLLESISNLKSLQILWLQGNQLSTLPESITKLKSLQELELFGNKLSTLPESIGNLSSLHALSLYKNQLTILPVSLWRCKNLELLSLNDNPWEEEWKEIIKYDVPKVLEMCRQRAFDGNEEKLEEFCDEPYEYNKQYKRDFNLFDAETRKFDEERKNVETIIDELIESVEFREILKENLPQLKELSEELRVEQISPVEYLFRCDKILNSKSK